MKPWTDSTLGGVSQLVGGGTPSRSEANYFGGTTDWVTPTDLSPIGEVRELGDVKETLSDEGLRRSSATLLPMGTVLFSSRASIGKIAVTNRPCATNQGFANLVPNADLIDPWFLAYYLCHATPEILRLAGETTYKEVSRSKLKLFPISFPTVEEQRRIVNRIKECLTRADEIAALRDENLQDAAKIEGATFADFLEEEAKSGCPEVQLGDVLVQSQYGTSIKASTSENGTPILRMGNIQCGHLDFSNLKYVQLSDDDLDKYRLRPGDIVINRTNSLELVGKSALFDRSGDWVFASYLVRLVVDRSKALPEFVNAAINSRLGRAYVYATARRAIGMVNINAREIAKMPLPLPSIEKQQEIVGRLKLTRNAAQSLLGDMSAEPVGSLPKAVLRRAFSGEL
jgi:type I restriction enzyme S subunit